MEMTTSSLLHRSDLLDIKSSLEKAKTTDDVRALIDRYGYNNVAPVFDQINPVQKAALLLMRAFNGSQIIHQSNESDRGQSDPI